MAYKNLPTASSFTVANRVNSVLIQVNTAVTASITVTAPVKDVNGVTTTATVATITTPSTGQSFRYWDMPYGFTVTTVGTGDVTVNWQGNRQAV
jgi:hypothetical protein